LNHTVLAIALIILVLFPIVLLEETSTQSLFKESTPPDPLMSDLMWIRQEFGNAPKIIVAKGYWPDGVFNAFLGWAIVFLKIDMKSSFVYIGQLDDLLTGKPSGSFYGFPSNEVVIQDPLKYHIFILNYEDKWLNFYDPNPLEMLILKSLRPNVYEVKEISALEVAQWSKLWKSIATGQIPEGHIGYIESSFANWTARFGYITALENGVNFTLWQNATEGWIEARGLEVNYQSYPFILMWANTNGGILNYIDFYNPQNKFMGRWKIGSTTSDWTIFIFDLRNLNLPADESIWRMVIVLSSVKESRSLLIEWIVFMNLTFPTSPSE